MGTSLKTGKTGKRVALFKRRMPDFRGTELKLNNNARTGAVKEMGVAVLAGLAGLPRSARCKTEWLSAGALLVTNDQIRRIVLVRV